MTTDIIGLLAGDRSLVAYRPKLNQLTGGVLATIFLQQVIFRWRNNGSKPFYKFNEPCGHELCRKGDSWTEELGFSKNELYTARKKVAKKIGRGDSKTEAQNEYFILYWTDGDRVTWYELNESLLEHALKDLYKSEKQNYIEESKKRNYQESQESGNTFPITETTTETTTERKGANAPPLDFPDPQSADTPHSSAEAKERIKHAAIESEKVGPQALARAFEDEFTYNIRLHKTNRLDLKRLIEAGARPADIPAFRKWWHENDWRGKQGEPPTPGQAFEKWPRFTEWRDNGKDSHAAHSRQPTEAEEIRAYAVRLWEEEQARRLQQ